MTEYLDPKSLGLPSRTIVEKVDKKTLAIVMNRKSRIIMADGRKILEKVTQIESTEPGMNIVLKTSAPICSKTLQLFKNKGLIIIT